MKIELSQNELRELHQALSYRLDALFKEIVRTEDRSYRAGLSQEHFRLEQILQRLETTPETERRAS